MSFGSGSVISAPRVSLIFYGSRWDAFNRALVYSFVSNLGSSDWWKISTEYTGDGGSAVGASIVVDGWYEDRSLAYSEPVTFYGVGGRNITDVVAYVDHVVANGLVAVTAPSAPHLIFVLGDDRTMTIGSCTAHCGWHQHGMRTYGANRYYVSWIGNPKFCVDGYGVACGGGGLKSPNVGGIWGQWIDAQLSIVAHELTEWATNPDGKQWWDRDANMENGDLCAYQYGALWPSCNGQTANTVVGGNAYTIQMNHRLNVGCVNAAATPVPHPSCSRTSTPFPTRTRSQSKSTTPSSTISPTFTSTASLSVGASPSQTASASSTSTPTASSTPSSTATVSCFFTPRPWPRVPYPAFNPDALTGVCIQCGVGGIGDPGPVFDSFVSTPSQTSASSVWLKFGSIGLGAPLALALGDGGARRRAQVQPSPSAKSVPSAPVCYAVNGSTVVPFAAGDGFTAVCSDASGGYFAADMSWDQSVSVAALPVGDLRVLGGWSPSAVACFAAGGCRGCRAYVVARDTHRSACTLAACSHGGLTVVVQSRVALPPGPGIIPPEPPIFEYGGTVAGVDVVALATYSLDDAGATVFYATRSSADAPSKLFAAAAADLVAFSQSATQDDGVRERFFGQSRGLFELPPGPCITALGTVPHSPNVLVAYADAATGQSTLALLGPVAGAGFQLVGDAAGRVPPDAAWGAPNPLPLPDPSVLDAGGRSLRRRLNNGSPLYAQAISVWTRGAGRADGCNQYLVAIAATQSAASAPRRRLDVGDGTAGGALVVYDAGTQTWEVVPDTVDAVRLRYDAVLPPVRSLWAATPSATPVPPGVTPPASPSPPPTQPPSRTPSLTADAQVSPTRRPWNVTRTWPLSNILVTRVGPSSQGATDGTLTAPVFLDEFLTARPLTHAVASLLVSTTAMPLVMGAGEYDDWSPLGRFGVDAAPPSTDVCTLPLLPPGPCAEAHGQTALDGSYLAFACFRVLEGARADAAAAADRVLVTVSSTGVRLSTPLVDAADSSASHPSLCSVARAVTDASAYVAAGVDGLSAIAPDFTLARPAVAPPQTAPLQHVLLATGFSTGDPTALTLFASSAAAFAWASFAADGSVDGWSTLPVPVPAAPAPAFRGFAVYSDAVGAARLWACDTNRGVLQWSTTWRAGQGAGPLTTAWTSVGGVTAVGAYVGCQGMLVRDEGAAAVSLQLYVTTTPLRGANALYKLSAAGTLTLLATSPTASAFRGVFAPPTAPRSHTPSPSPSRTARPSRTPTRTARPSRTPAATRHATVTSSRKGKATQGPPPPPTPTPVPTSSPCVDPQTGAPCSPTPAPTTCGPNGCGPNV